MVDRYFPVFDTAAQSAKIAARENRLELEVVTEWDAKAKAAAEYGARVHAYAEALVLGEKPALPTDAKDVNAFRIVDKALVMLSDHYEFLPPEQIIFDPLYLTAGTIDLPARNKSTGTLAVLDWKTCESITSDSFGAWGLPPIKHVPASKIEHYTIQLSLYGFILTDPTGSYPSTGEPVELALIHIPHFGTDPIWRPVAYRAKEAAEILLNWTETKEFKEAW